MTKVREVLARQSEAAFQQQVIDLARLCGWRVGHFRSVHVQRKDGTTYWQTPVQADGAGFPDLVLAKKGRAPLFVELKAEDGALSMDQRAWLDALGDVARVWRPSDWDDIEATLR